MTQANNDTTGLLTGSEEFSLNGENMGFNVLDFWRFQYSNLSDLEGRVGEFLVAMALGKDSGDNNNGWTLWDINYKGKRVEVKTTSYYKTWRKEGTYSEVRTFGIQQTYPNKDGNPNTYSDNKEEVKVRNNDIYIFVINLGKTKEEADPLNLNNWRFYVVATKVINDKCGSNKTISLKKVQNLSGHKDGLMFDELKAKVDQIIEKMKKSSNTE